VKRNERRANVEDKREKMTKIREKREEPNTREENKQ